MAQKRKPGRPRKAKNDAYEASVRIKMTKAAKAAYEKAREVDGFPTTSSWFRHWVLERIAAMRNEGKLPKTFMVPDDDSTEAKR